ncbi:BTB/POZ domain-containing protein At1g30440-like isoform X3 [Salvia splendens]|uniref:BTB/POZ domain-containing protein At1g30440-like isoform X3 n=1 Tax=Salvia splendens TaxID=180675 RepID=UPI001C26AEB8|nr:BTB/POZ domain-containing protein At1g30440-like isoform X3 [Salvia splendens]
MVRASNLLFVKEIVVCLSFEEMACVKLGSKTDAFQRQGQAWFCTSGLPSDVVVEVEEMSFHLHKFPLLSRSGVMERLVEEASQGEEGCVIKLDIPGGAKTFETVAKFCYGAKLELTAANVVYLRCAAEYLEMTEEYGEGNLISRTESFLDQVVLETWNDSLQALQACDDILSHAEQLGIPRRCIDSLASKPCADRKLLGWPVMEHGDPLQSPAGSLLWNGISTGAQPNSSSSEDWWYDDASVLSFALYKRLILAMQSQGVKPEIIAGSLNSYAKKYLPGLHWSRGPTAPRNHQVGSLSEEDQKLLVEEIDYLLPLEKGLVPSKFLFGLLKTARILRASPLCVSNLEKRIGLQLDQAALEDLLMPTLMYSMETLYDVDCVSRILDHFLAMDQVAASPGSFDEGQLLLTPMTMVAKLIDGYLAEVAPDVNLKPPKFEALAAAVPEYARPLDDGLYRSIDIYLKSHPWLADADRDHLCRLIDCQKLSLEACTHAAQNERLPLRTIIQVLFFEQLQLRTSVAGCMLVSDNLDISGQAPDEEGWTTKAVREKHALKENMDNMRSRVSELEEECWKMREEIRNLGRTKRLSIWGNVAKKLGFKFQMCSAEEGSVCNQKEGNDNSKLRNDKEKKIPTSNV